MIGSAPNPRNAVQIVERWCPGNAYRSEKKFQNDLQDHLDGQLNRGGGDPLNGGGRNVVVSKEHGQVNADIAVGDDIGIELKRDLTNSQKMKLRGQIEEYREHYGTVIAVACGVKDIDGWRDLQNAYQQCGGAGLGGGLGGGTGGKAQVFFVRKMEENFGTVSSDQGGVPFDDRGLW